jgi:hypothetical protein
MQLRLLGLKIAHSPICSPSFSKTISIPCRTHIKDRNKQKITTQQLTYWAWEREEKLKKHLGNYPLLGFCSRRFCESLKEIFSWKPRRCVAGWGKSQKGRGRRRNKNKTNKKKIVCQVRAELGGEFGSVKLFFKMAKIIWLFGFLIAKFMI